MRITAIIAALGALALPGAASALQGSSTVPTPAPAAEKKTCESYTVTGSRLAKKRVCGTREEWAERRLQDRQAIEKVQTSPCMLQHNGGTGRPSC